jgi:hypothetical protein
MAERAQERDEDLAWAYSAIDEQRETIRKKNITIVKMGIAIGILALVIIAAVALSILKLYGKIKFPWLGNLGEKTL